MIQIKLKHYDKWERLREAQKVFKKLNVKHEIHNNGIHWIIEYNDTEINYWPTTGKWYIADPKHQSTHEERFLGGILKYMGYQFQEID